MGGISHGEGRYLSNEICGHAASMGNRCDDTTKMDLIAVDEAGFGSNLRIDARAPLGVSSLHGEPGWLYTV